jgi:hypothetical protein
VAFLATLILCTSLAAQTTTFTYQGNLRDNSALANGNYDFEFALFNLPMGGSQIGMTATRNSVPVNNGIFSVPLDFGAAFPGSPRYLEVRVRLAGQPGFTTLNPREMITSSPHSIRALSASDADFLGGQPPSNFATSGQHSMLEMQVISLLGQVSQLQTELAAATGGTQLWAKNFGNTLNNFGYGVAYDPSGNVVVTGSFQGTINLGGSNFVSGGGFDSFVAKYSGQTGSHIWSKAFGSTVNDEGRGIAVDSNGDVFVTGYFNGTVNFGGTMRTSSGGDDVFLIKLSGTDGSTIFARNFGGTSGDQGNSVTVDANGDPTITGIFRTTADFLGLPLVSAGNTDIFVAKYNGATSSHIWSKGFGGTSFESGNFIAADQDGNVYTTGTFQTSTISFGGSPLMNAGLTDGYYVKLAGSNGAHIWTKGIVGPSQEVGVGVAVDLAGNNYVTGTFASPSINLGGGPLSNAGTATTDNFIAKYDSKGTHLWSKPIGGSSNDNVTGIAASGSGDVFITGSFEVATSLGGPSLNASNTDIFVAKYTGPNGTHIWSRRIGGTDVDVAHAIAVDPAGDPVLTGDFFSATVDLGGGPILNPNGGGDIPIIKLKK